MNIKKSLRSLSSPGPWWIVVLHSDNRVELRGPSPTSDGIDSPDLVEDQTVEEFILLSDQQLSEIVTLRSNQE